jgi:hypothetical protein
MSESDSFPNPKIEITADMDEKTILAEWQRGKAALEQRARERCYEKSKNAVAAWRHQYMSHMGQIPPLEELKIELQKLTKQQVENRREDWADDLQSFKDFLKMIAEKQQVPEGTLDLSTPTYGLGSTSSKQLFNVLVEAVPYAEKAIKCVEEIIVAFDERLGFFKSLEAQIPVWLKEAESLAQAAKRPAEKINKLFAEAKEQHRTDQRKKARKTLSKAILLMNQYRDIDIKFSEIAKNLYAHSIPHPYFPPTIGRDKLQELLRQCRVIV